MKELSTDETFALVNSFVQSYGQRGAARSLNKSGYRSPEGKEIQHGTITRILNGSETKLLAPEVKGPLPGPEQALPPGELPPEFTPEASPSVTPKHEEPPIATPLSREEIAKEEARRELHTKTRKALREELEEEIAAQKLRESELPALVPSVEDHGGAGHPHLQELARVHAIFSPRAPVELDENEATFFNVPCLKRKPVEVRTQPHEVRHFGSISLSTRDLNARQKE